MDIATAGALSLYAYRSALNTGGQASALAQALSQSTSSANAAVAPLLDATSTSDGFSTLLGEVGQSDLVSGTYTAAVHAGKGTSQLQSLLQTTASSTASSQELFGSTGFSSLDAATAYASYAYQTASDSGAYLSQAIAGASGTLAKSTLDLLG